MSLYEKWFNAFHTKDIEAAKALLHEDYTFVRHQSGTTMNKAQTMEMMKAFMSSDHMTVHNQRCLYENDEVMVEHSVIDFPDGSTEALLSFYKIEDGQFIRCETGATLIKK